MAPGWTARDLGTRAVMGALVFNGRRVYFQSGRGAIGVLDVETGAESAIEATGIDMQLLGLDVRGERVFFATDGLPLGQSRGSLGSFEHATGAVSLGALSRGGPGIPKPDGVRAATRSGSLLHVASYVPHLGGRVDSFDLAKAEPERGGLRSQTREPTRSLASRVVSLDRSGAVATVDERGTLSLYDPGVAVPRAISSIGPWTESRGELEARSLVAVGRGAVVVKRSQGLVLVLDERGMLVGQPSIPEWAPWQQGTWLASSSGLLAFGHDDEGRRPRLGIVDAKTGERHAVAFAEKTVAGAWSPDGRLVVMTWEGKLFLLEPDKPVEVAKPRPASKPVAEPTRPVEPPPMPEKPVPEEDSMEQDSADEDSPDEDDAAEDDEEDESPGDRRARRAFRYIRRPGPPPGEIEDKLPTGARLMLGTNRPGVNPSRGLSYPDPICGVFFSPDGRTLATADGQELVERDVASGVERRRVAVAGSAIAFASDGKTVAVVGDEVSQSWRGPPTERVVHVIDASTGKQRLELHVPEREGEVGEPEATVCVAFVPGTSTLVTGGARLGWWDVSTGDVARWLRDSSVSAVAASADGHVALAQEINVEQLGDDDDLSPGVSLLAPGKDDAEGLDSFDLERNGSLDGLALSPDGKWVAAFGRGARGVVLWDTATRQKRELEKTGPVAFHPRKPWLAVVARRASGRQGIDLVDLETLKLVRELEGHKGGISALAFSPDASTLASVSGASVFLWEIAAS